jgi:SAM-dependent methyltransferase
MTGTWDPFFLNLTPTTWLPTSPPPQLTASFSNLPPAPAFSLAPWTALPPSVSLVSTDLNQPMLDFAATRSDGRITWRQADAQQLPFPDNSIDAVVCQFGVMFFPDKVAAYREVRRVLNSSGRFHFSVWDRPETNELSHAAIDAVRSFFKNDPPLFVSRVPFGYFDTQLIRSELRAASFSSIDVETVSLLSHATSALDAATGICQGTPLRNELEARDPALVPQVTSAVAASLSSRFGPGPFTTKMQAHLFTAAR